MTTACLVNTAHFAFLAGFNFCMGFAFDEKRIFDA